ncbi:FxSxx-COOH system tetratricopeptide repeat protein [Streptomyces sp. NPDC058326]|uniref:FxSxx-COOH system tetratricopeptide repeat protein n=1 Tax=Streptomyces sp. NPDC058326 TaxID=3346447 RepID=UPI0036DFD859
MDPQRLVWVRTGGPEGAGSGYLIGPQLVLTALHVVLGDGRWAERAEARVGHPRFGDLVERRAEVCWPDTRDGVPGVGAPDVALLWLDRPVPASGGPVRWGRPGGTARLPFNGAGFPAFAADAGSAAQVEDLHGELSVVGTSLPGWVLDCPVWPASRPGGERPWAGASGSAVFCHGRLVGVAVEDNRTMNWRRLHAAPLHEALRLPGFAGLVTRHGHPGTTTVLEEVTGESGTPGADGVVWPVEVGPVPALASAFQPRSVLRDRIDAARSGGGSVVLTQVLSGGGGFGKTQLAAACATDALAQDVDLVVWASATEVQQVITQYAQAAADIRLPGATGQDPEADARALLKWLATTSRRWLVVLDDVVHPTELGGWWPVSRTGTGWVLATTRLHDARLTGHGRSRVDIDVYTPAEAGAYLRERLHGDGMDHLLDDRAADLAEALGHLPLALGLAAAHMINEELTCADYVRRFTDRRTRLEEALPETADTEGYGRPIAVALLLSLDAARAADTTGLVLPALRLAALLDPAGHPRALWAAPPVLRGLSPAGPVTADRTHTVLRLLHRYALLTCDTRAEPRAVRVHALTARAVRENTPEAQLAHLAGTAAAALLHIWPEIDQSHPDLAAALRANTDVLADHARDRLWDGSGHSVLYRAGNSLLDAGLSATAATHWQRVTDDAARLLGAGHRYTLAARGNLAASYREAGRTGEAIAIEEQVAADTERLLGDQHADTLIARASLACSYRMAGRVGEAIAIEERVSADCRRVLDDDDPRTLAVLANLAASYWEAGRVGEAIEIEERVVADSRRVLGERHPDTLSARGNLAASYREAGRTGEAIAIEEQVAADSARVLGDSHPDTITALANLATSYWKAGRTGEALAIEEQVAADSARILGDSHPDTLTALGNLAASYQLTRRIDEAIAIEEQVAVASARVQGDHHPDTLIARVNLASSYLRAGRVDDALRLLRPAAVDCARELGDGHPVTRAARDHLAAARRQT